MGKKEFYPIIASAYMSQGYQYFDGDKDIKGKGKSHASKPDYIATNGNEIIIGEIKSHEEGPKSGSWRKIQKSDSEYFKNVRQEVSAKEKSGELCKEVGGHEIIIRGQIPDYISKINKTFLLPICVSNKKIKGGYSVPVSELKNVEKALNNLEATYIKFIQNGSANFIINTTSIL